MAVPPSTQDAIRRPSVIAFPPDARGVACFGFVVERYFERRLYRHPSIPAAKAQILMHTRVTSGRPGRLPRVNPLRARARNGITKRL
jgi:hypothetical protein